MDYDTIESCQMNRRAGTYGHGPGMVGLVGLVGLVRLVGLVKEGGGLVFFRGHFGGAHEIGVFWTEARSKQRQRGSSLSARSWWFLYNRMVTMMMLSSVSYTLVIIFLVVAAYAGVEFGHGFTAHVTSSRCNHQLHITSSFTSPPLPHASSQHLSPLFSNNNNNNNNNHDTDATMTTSSTAANKKVDEDENLTSIGSTEYYKGFITRSAKEEPIERVTGDAILGPTLKFAGGVSFILVALVVVFLGSNGLL